MKRFFIVVLTLIGFIFLTLILVPVLFKGKIQEAIQRELDKTLNAEVTFDPANFRVSLLSDFPNLTVGLADFSLTGKEPFKGDTLFAANDFELEIDLKSIIAGDQIQINAVALEKPVVNILVLQDGAANYDIMKDTGEETEEDTTDEESSEVKIGIKEWIINEGDIVYYDQSANMGIFIHGLNHVGTGDFTLDVFDMKTQNEIQALTVVYDDVEYISRKKVNADITLGMDLANMKFTFKENNLKVNDFNLGFDGYFAMPTDDYEMDITFAAKENTFKSLLSLVPGMYADGFESLETKGELSFSGFVKGIYNEKQMPAFDIAVNVKDGYVKSPEVPLPISHIDMDVAVKSETGDLKDGILQMDNFGLTIDGDRFTAKAIVKNFDVPDWNLSAKGKLNLDVVSKIEPTDEFSLAGIINANLISSGNYTMLEQERYDLLETKGSLAMENFRYSAADMPDFTISQASLNFNPEIISLENFKAKFGKSDFSLKGDVTNYLNYALKEDAVLEGNLSLYSDLIDINEFMSSEEAEEEETTETDSAAMEVVPIPKDLYFTFDARIATIVYDNLELKNAVGKIVVKDGILTMDPIDFNLLGGEIGLAGTYNTQNEDKPLFNFDLDIKKLSIKQAYSSFVTVQKLAPIAEKVNGDFSTDFTINGALTSEMMPDFETLAGAGLIKVANAAVEDSKLISGVTSLTKLDNTNSVSLKDVIMQAEIREGKLFVQPFDLQFGKYKATIDGNTSITGAIDYNLKMNVPTGAAGTAANKAISSLLGTDVKAVGSSVNLNFNIGGTYADPDIKLGKTETNAGGEDNSVKAVVQSKIDAEKAKAEAEAKKAIEEAKAKAKLKADSIKKATEEAIEKEKEKLKDQAKDKLKDLFKKGGGN